MPLIFAIAGGGALGAVLRHFMNVWVMGLTSAFFPWGIFTINVIGSFLMGALAAFFAHVVEPSATLKAFLTVGVLGGFTTFSAYSLDIATLIDRGAFAQAAFYSIGSVVCAVLALYAGMALIKMVVA